MSACGAYVGWHTLPRDLLEQQLDYLGIERAMRFETGVKDTAENVERLSDYSDAGDDPDHPMAPSVPTRHLLLNSCPGSRQPADDDVLCEGGVTCSTCGQVARIYRRSNPVGWFKFTHLVSEGDAQAAPSKTN